MLSADRGKNMSGIERFVALLFLAGAVAGAAAFGQKLGGEQAPPTAAVSLLPGVSALPDVAVEAQPAPPLSPMLPAHRPLRLVRPAIRPAAAPVVRTTPALPARPVRKPIEILRVGPRAPQPDTTPQPAVQPAASKPATPVAAPSPRPAPVTPIAAPAQPDVQVVLAATEQVVAPVTDGESEDDDHGRHGRDRDEHGREHDEHGREHGRRHDDRERHGDRSGEHERDSDD
jgi:hypothetical protein